jgi:hypothetical protein
MYIFGFQGDIMSTFAEWFGPAPLKIKGQMELFIDDGSSRPHESLLEGARAEDREGSDSFRLQPLDHPRLPGLEA